MANIISDETIEYVGILAKLSLSEEEREQAKKDMGRMLDYIDKLNELDTTGVEPTVPCLCGAQRVPGGRGDRRRWGAKKCFAMRLNRKMTCS